MPPTPRQVPSRSRLEEAPDVYAIALSVADRLDGAGLDLWAAGVRACLDAEGSTARQEHLLVELTRLSHMSMVRQQGLQADIATALGRLEAGLGRIDVPIQPLYTAVRELADHLELNGGRRWLGRLRAVMADDERTAEARLRRLVAVLELMQPGTPGLPEGSATRVGAVSVRLPRHREAEDTARYVGFALRPPQASRRPPTPVAGERPVAGRA